MVHTLSEPYNQMEEYLALEQPAAKVVLAPLLPVVLPPPEALAELVESELLHMPEDWWVKTLLMELSLEL